MVAKTERSKKILGKNVRKDSLSTAYYVDHYGNPLRSIVELMVASNMAKYGLYYDYMKAIKINGKMFKCDFFIPPNIIIEVFKLSIDKEAINNYKDKIRKLISKGYKVIIIINKDLLRYFNDLKKRFNVKIISIIQPRFAELNVKNITNLDYAHILPSYKGRCSNYHSHTSYNISVSFKGFLDKEGMVIDFSLAKKIVRKVVKDIDHRLVICKEYCKLKGKKVIVEYRNKNGNHKLILPKEEVLMLEGEATVENIGYYMAEKILSSCPKNVCGISVSLTEGTNSVAFISCSRPYFNIPFKGLNELKGILKSIKSKSYGK